MFPTSGNMRTNYRHRFGNLRLIYRSIYITGPDQWPSNQSPNTQKEKNELTVPIQFDILFRVMRLNTKLLQASGCYKVRGTLWWVQGMVYSVQANIIMNSLNKLLLTRLDADGFRIYEPERLQNYFRSVRLNDISRVGNDLVQLRFEGPRNKR